MQIYIERAIDNIIDHGDTDIFPFPVENHIFYDCRAELKTLLFNIHKNLSSAMAAYPPANESMLAPVGYTGFRWATQIDPPWNAYFLSLVLCIAEQIEAARIPPAKNVVFSYRYRYDECTHDVFRRDIGWQQFMEYSSRLASDCQFVVMCDIADCYQRIGHHRLENALKQLEGVGDIPSRIMRFLSNFSNTKSYGLPIGGPAARILSELVLNQSDRLLRANGISFCRYADDYHIFTATREEAYNALVFLSRKLVENEGLALQKSKTRIMTAHEFLTLASFNSESGIDKENQDGTPESVVNVTKISSVRKDPRAFMRLSLRFDPYSATATEDYEALSEELQRFDVVGMLRDELAKSRVHTAVARKLIAAIRYLDPPQRRDAILSLLGNLDLLYPIFASVALVVRAIFNELERETQDRVIEVVQDLILSESYIVKTDLNLAFALRTLSCRHTPENEEILVTTYTSRDSGLIRRDIILIMARWRQWYWISHLRNRFRTLGAAERRAFIIASYILGDEGRHWRDYIKDELTDFEKLVKDWAANKTNDPGWAIPV